MVPRSAEECRGVPSSAGRGGGVPKSAEECRGVPSSSTTIEIPLKWKGSSSRGRLVVPRTAEWDRLVPGGVGKYHYNRKGEATEGR